MTAGRVGFAWQLLTRPMVRYRLKTAGVVLGTDVVLWGCPIVDLAGRGSVRIGDRSVLASDPQWTALGVSRPVIMRTLLPTAVITIGSDVGMSGTTVCAARSVTIGDRVLLGADVMIVDTDFHPVDELPRRYLPIPTPAKGDEVVIGPDAFIGARSVILKGSQVGAGAVVGAGSVVSGVVPPRAIVAGAPAKFIRWVAASADEAGAG